MFKKLIVLLLVMNFIMAACGSPTSEVEEETVSPSSSFTVPSYATYVSVLDEAYFNSPLDDYRVTWLWDYDLEDVVVENGFVGAFSSNRFLWEMYAGDFGQDCWFSRGDDSLEYDVESKTITMHVRATTLNLDFLQYCQEVIPNTAEIYVVTARSYEDGFIITSSPEEWLVKTIFRLDE